MKRIILIFSLLIPLVFTGGAPAQTIPVDFSVQVDPADITNTIGPTLNGVTFSYDDLGSGSDFAQVDSAGVFGSSGGSLILDFATRANGLNFDFTMTLDGDEDDSQIYAFTLFFRSINFVDFAQVPAIPDPDPANLVAYGVFAYQGFEFDRAIINFSPVDPDTPHYFTLANLTYNVPEPATLLLLAFGIIGLGGLGRGGSSVRKS